MSFRPKSPGSKRRRLLGLTTAVLFAIAAVSVTRPTLARVSVETGYTKTQLYHAALRYLRVELGYEVLEKDAEAAYLIFRYEPPSHGKNPSTGSIEIVDAQPDETTLIVRLPKLPAYHEQVLRDGLLKKLRDEYGPPVRRAPKPAPDSKPKPPKQQPKPEPKPPPDAAKPD